MNTRDAIVNSLQTASMVCDGYLSDLTDQEMLARPHKDCNHIKWQMGHLIAAEHEMQNTILPGSMPPLPDGFAARYAKETCTSDKAADFDSKEELMRVYKQQREATLKNVANQTDATLDKPSPEAFAAYAPTWGAVLMLQGGHWLMHAGQWAVIRRQHGRAPLF